MSDVCHIGPSGWRPIRALPALPTHNITATRCCGGNSRARIGLRCALFVKPLGQWEAIRPEITDPLVAAVSALLIAGTALLALLLDRLFGLDRLLAGHR